MANQRKIYLINPRFQLKVSILVCFMIFLSSLIYPITIFNLFTNFIGYVAKYSPGITEQLVLQKNSLITILALWQLGFTCLIFVICIFFTHKIAGPIYKIRTHLQNIREGKSLEPVFLRRGDYFHELADELNETLDTIQEEYKRDFVYLGEVSSYISNLSLAVPEDKKAVLNEITEKLGEIQERFN